MSSLRFVTNTELEQLYPQEVHDQIARLLRVRSRDNLADLREQVFRMASAYDMALAVEPTHPPNSEIRQHLKKVQERVSKLGIAIGECNGYARNEVSRALSKARTERKLANGEDVLPRGHIYSNEQVFDHESLAYFCKSLLSLYRHLSKVTENLKTGGKLAGPEQEAIRYLADLWKKHYGEAPYKQSLRPFQDLCELTLRPIANRRGKKPNLKTTAKNVLYGRGLEPPPGWWEV
jgi:hypothetical protein